MQSPLQLQTGVPHDIVISAVLRKLAEHEPFRTYSHAVVVNAVMAQLQHGANVMGLRDGKLVAYAGWLRVQQSYAEAWLREQADLPVPDWENADAVIVTVFVADHPADIRLMIRAISNACANMPVYRLRVFENARHEQKRKPITGRLQVSV